jgi:hypothetical protein
MKMAGRTEVKYQNTHHSKSEYIMVKNTCRNRLTALIMTAKRYNHASPDIMTVDFS